MAPNGDNYQVSTYVDNKIARDDFPKGFVFGASTSAYQVEGAYAKGGRALSNWDIFTLETPGNVSDFSNGCIAIDQYHRYQEDVRKMKELGLDAYRFSLAWSRLLPGGRVTTGVNEEGVKYYNDLINFCIAEGVKPIVTILHFDIPQRLQDEYGGFLGDRFVKDFAGYAEFCFSKFGDRVKHWITVNEPLTIVCNGYVQGTFPPGHGSSTSLQSSKLYHRGIRRPPQAVPIGDPSKEPYIVAHHLILGHAYAVDIYRKQYQVVQGGEIGLTTDSEWYVPLTETVEDAEAALRGLDFHLGWFYHPLVFGDYPKSMRENVGERLPVFHPREVEVVRGSYDFLGLNYYTSSYAANAPNPPGTPQNYNTDQQVAYATEKDGKPIGPVAGSDWLYIVPYGIHRLLVYIKEKYNDPRIYITENGVDEKNDKSLTVVEATNDVTRILYYESHLSYVKQAIDEGVRVEAFYMWCIFDNFEWSEGFSVRFGIYYVDYANGLVRYPKLSVTWWRKFLNAKVVYGAKKRLQIEEIEEKDSVKKPKSRR